jgi:hypothetical protein
MYVHLIEVAAFRVRAAGTSRERRHIVRDWRNAAKLSRAQHAADRSASKPFDATLRCARTHILSHAQSRPSLI